MSEIAPVPPPTALAAARAHAHAPAAPHPLDAARADKLRAAIEGGGYPLDVSRLADRLLELGLVTGRAK